MKTFLKNNKKIQKIIASIFLILILAPTFWFATPVKQTEAFWPVVDWPALGIAIKDLAGQAFKQAMMAAGRKMINNLTQRTVNWINSGFHGDSFYVENQDNFFKDIVKYEVRNVVDQFAYNKAKFPFGRDFAINTIEAYRRQLNANYEYTLSSVINDPVYLEQYRTDFNVGGWDGFFINTQYPQNNYIGSQMLFSDDLARRLDGTTSNVAQKVQDTLQKSNGFLAPETCPSNPKYNNLKNAFRQPTFDYTNFAKTYTGPTATGDSTAEEIAAAGKAYDAALAKAKAEWSAKNTCPGGLQTTTPGKIIGNMAEKALTSKFNQAELAAAMGNGLALIFDVLINKFIGEGGLKKLSGAVENTSNTPSYDYKGGIQLPTDTGGGAQVCIDNCLAKGDGTGDQCSSSCTDLSAGPSGYTNNPLDFFNFPGGSTGGSGGGNGSGNTGGNPKCIDAEGVAAYDQYVSAVAAAEAVAYPAGLPAGTTGATAQAAVCGAYKGAGACRAGAQEDEVIITGLTTSPYVTMSIDFLIGSYPYASNALYARGVAACEAGVQ